MRIELQSKKAKLKTAGKFVEEDIEVAAKLQSKNVTPTESPQTVNTDSGFSGIDKVEVGAIPSDYVGSAITRKGETTYTPTTTDQEIASGQYLSGKQVIKGDSNLVAENIAKGQTIFGVTGTHEGGITPEGTLYINTNGKYDVTDKAEVDVNVSVPTDPIDPPVFGFGTFNENGEYNAEDYGIDGWSGITINVPTDGGDCNLVELTVDDMDLSSGSFEILPRYTEPYNEDLDLSTIEVDKGEATYGFVYDSSTGRLEPTNKRSANTYSYGRINFDFPTDGNTIKITIYQSSEVNYDYGFISKLDLPLDYDYDTNETNAIYNSRGLSGEYTHTFTDVPAGEHFITFKYRKDGSGDNGSDTFAIVKINVNGSKLVPADGMTKAIIVKSDKLVPENIRIGETVYGVEGACVPQNDDLNKLIANTATEITVNLTSIGDYALYYKNQLQTINGTINANSSSIRNAFGNTNKLKKANIKINYNGTNASPSNMFNYAFNYCGKDVGSVNSQVDVYFSSDKTLTANTSYSSMFSNASLRKVVFGEGVEVIGSQSSQSTRDMFNNCSIKELHLNNVKTIEGYDTSSQSTFYRCSIGKLYLPSLTNWGRGAINSGAFYWKVFFGADSCILYDITPFGQTAKKYIKYDVLDNYSSATGWVSLFTNDGAEEAKMFVYGDFTSGDTLPTQIGTTQVYNVTWYEDDDFTTLASTVNTARYYGKITAVV